MSEVAIRAEQPRLEHPTRLSSLLFEAKAAVFRARRLTTDLLAGPSRLLRADVSGFEMVAGQSRTPLWSDTRAAERVLQWGKVHNLRVAAQTLDRTSVPAGSVFSFWKQLGRPSRLRGFVDGRMLKEGCLMRSTGGGLCQLSNALYEAALQAGCEIVERHAHSRIVPGSAAAAGRDATIAWNYVDLRFRAPRDLLLRVIVERDALDVRLLAREPGLSQEIGEPLVEATEAAETCATCNKTDCAHFERIREAPAGRTAFLVYANWPEFRDFVGRVKRQGDALALPLNGARWRIGRYRWDTAGFSSVTTATAATLARSAALRFSKDGAPRRRVEFRSAARIAVRLARALKSDVTEVYVAQSLLPYLWRDGHLGGRRFSILMTRLPMAEIQARLDVAARAHPERETLSDFRADADIVRAEAEALAAADQIITPHMEVAAMLGERALLLEWSTPKVRVRSDRVAPRRIAFPGPTLARKGAYELREAARALDLEVVLIGSELEGPDFWNGIRTQRADRSNWLDGVAAVVQPALVEESPRPLLHALAAGVPVIATKACGLAAQRGLTLVSAGDNNALIAALSACLL